MTNEESTYQTFEPFGFKDDIMKGIKEAGFRMPSPIQQEAVPVVMKGRDVVARAQTGTGKTAAFGLPTMNNISGGKGVELLVIVPTRELASQVSEELFRLGRYASIRTVAVYGGQSIGRQAEMVNRGAQVVVATPGRLLDHLKSKRFRSFDPSMVVLDEADEMLDMGFLEDIEKIFAFLPKDRQTLLFSATMPSAIKRLANKILKEPVAIDVTPSGTTTASDISQRYCVMAEREREVALVRLIDTESPSKAIVFCRTKKEADALSTTLISRGYSAKALHGDMDQRARNDAMESFRRGRIELLIATDVAARGLDVSDVSHVFNYHIPFDPQSYIHRIGRTGRAGKKGDAITLVTPLEFKELSRIIKVSGAPVTYREIPTGQEVKKKHINSLLDMLEGQHIHQEAQELLEQVGDGDEELLFEVAVRALSALMDRKKVTGPDRIGLSNKEADSLLRRSSGPQHSKGRPYKGRRPGPQGHRGGKGKSFGGSSRQGGHRKGR